jgi:hypothetical protein
MGERFNGDPVGWTSHLRNALPNAAMGTIDDVAANNNYAPPLRAVMITASGNLVVTLDGDDVNDATKKLTIPMLANTWETRFAIKKIWAAGSTTTGLIGAR